MTEPQTPSAGSISEHNCSTIPLTKRSGAGHSVATYFKAIKALGPRWVFKRAQLALLNKIGAIERRTPSSLWNQLSLADVLRKGIPADPSSYFDWRRESSPAFLFNSLPSASLLNNFGTKSITGADSLVDGVFPYFGLSCNLGYPPRWQQNPSNGHAAQDAHWSKIDEFAFGDVKLCWEASRFGWAYMLARAYARTKNDRYAETFWELLESWMEQNQPNRGIHWKCGQEASFRTMATCFAFYAFRNSKTSTPKRVALLPVLIGMLGRRIESYIEYALSQKNNHGISEGVGLWSIGLLFPELNGSERWRNRGKRVIESEVRNQLYDDGSYVQHSINYHRAMLQDLIWSLRLGELHDDVFPSDIYSRLHASVNFLHSLVDSTSGWAPNLGANDGTLVLPLSDCDFPDMRPILQSAKYLLEKQSLYDGGPWNEETIWMNGAASAALAPSPTGTSLGDLTAGSGGYYTIRSQECWALLRATSYRDRPSQADQLHVDLWWRGQNVLCDPGTYSYNCEPPFGHAFASTSYHNTVTVDSIDQMHRATRFLWTDWAKARVNRRHSTSNGIELLEAEHDGYKSLGVLHRRAMLLASECIWIVLDDITGAGKHHVRLHWMLSDAETAPVTPHNLVFRFPQGVVRIVQGSTLPFTFDLVRSGERIAGNCNTALDCSRGWTSRHYGRLEPAFSLALESICNLPIRFITVVLLESSASIHIQPACTSLLIDGRVLQLSDVGKAPIAAQFV